MQNLLFALSVLFIGLLGIILLMSWASKTMSKGKPAAPGEPDTEPQRNVDSDRDGLSDWDEVYKYGTNPHSYDTDADGIGDRHEILQGTEPTLVDTDGDHIPDGQEQNEGTDPRTYDR